MKRRHKLRVDALGVGISIAAMIVAVAIIVIGGKVSEHHAISKSHEVTER